MSYHVHRLANLVSYNTKIIHHIKPTNQRITEYRVHKNKPHPSKSTLPRRMPPVNPQITPRHKPTCLTQQKHSSPPILLGPRQPSNIFCLGHSLALSGYSSNKSVIMDVRMYPGDSELTRILYGPHSMARLRVSCRTAALLAL